MKTSVLKSSKLNCKIKLLEKQITQLTKIVANKEIIIQKVSSNKKNATKEIPNNYKTDCTTDKGKKTLIAKNYRMSEFTQRKHCPSRTSL